MSDRKAEIAALQKDWDTNPRWKGITRGYTAEDVVRLRGSLKIEHTLAKHGAERLWNLVNNEAYVNCLGALTGGQAMQQVKAGVQAIYLSGWQVAADGNSSAAMYPDQSLYPVDSVPKMVERINNSFQRADEIQTSKGIQRGDAGFVEYFAPIVADAEAGFGGVLNAFELSKALIKQGAAGVHFEDQLSSVKKCGHLGGKVLLPTAESVQKLISARLAADVMGVSTIILARTDAEAADLLTSDYDENDKPFLTGERTPEGFYKTRKGLDQAISRGLAYAAYADMVWCETGTPDLDFARAFAEAIRAKFQRELGAMGYKYQFITLAGIHSMWYNMFDLAQDYMKRGMTAYIEKVQEPEFAARDRGYTFVSHQQEVGTGYFDDVTTVIQGGKSSVTALTGSTEEEQFH